MKARAQKRTTGFAMVVVIIVGGILLGAVTFFAAKTINDRKSQQISATVRIADGTTEDEITIVTTKVTRKGYADKVVLTKYDYTVNSVQLSDDSLLRFSGCSLSGVYEPEKCTATNGSNYWVTLTETK